MINGYRVLKPKRLLTVKQAQSPYHVTTKRGDKENNHCIFTPIPWICEEPRMKV
jgi:hypothetical protein